MFRTAARHSRNVRALKIALPALALVMAALFLFQSYRSSPGSVEIVAETSAVSEGKLVMANPKLEGFTEDNRPYSVSALRAVQDIANEAIVELQGIAATLPLNDEMSATIDAARGVFDRNMNTLDVNSEINITTSDGSQAKLGSALIDIAGGRMTTDKPVEIRFKNGSINSDALSVEQNGKLVVFDKRVRVNIVPPKAETASQ
ncbi:LPS export ABC transporter periplasmic protein LptC [Kumtagia ephedrae]|nr:LPS export ABC transporter periplasmic protein LptC [Mesorhizobium ephedrae]